MQHEFLVLFGKLRNQRQYRFRDRATELRSHFAGKVVLKIDIGTPYAPHPGNRQIHYSNLSFGVSPYEFADLGSTDA